jgi:hypothetical protein
MEFVDAMGEYFAGEKSTGLGVAAYGVVLAAAAFWLSRTQQGGFMWALAIPLGVLGLGALVGGIVLFAKTGPQLDALIELHRSDPAAFIAQELPRMQKVNANWPRLEAAWTVLIVGGLASVWLSGRDWLHGLALTLLVLGTTGMIIDVFAERRAKLYTARLTALTSTDR